MNESCPRGPGQTRWTGVTVSVTVAVADEEVARAQATLERDLEKYKRFVLDRCEKMQCCAD